jgi:tetratricopeptide (TPR) repeat protein
MRKFLVACSYLAASALWGEISLARDTAGPDRERAERAKPAPAAEPASNATAKTANEPPATALEAQAPAARSASPMQTASDGDPGRTDEAKRLYGLGAEAFAARRNAEAIRYFRRAAAIVPSPKLTYNIALAYEELGDTGRAIAEYRDYLRHETEVERAEEVRRRVGELERKLGATGVQLLSVTSEPRGAVVRLGTEPVGITPWIGEPPLGTHEVSVELPGYEVRRDRVLLAADHAYDLDVTLAPRAPALAVAERAAPARVQPLTWTFLGVGAGAVLGGVAFELSRAKSSERAGRSDSPVEAAEARGAADAKQMASLLLLGSGTAFLIGGGVLLTLDLSASDTKTPSSSDSLTSARINLPCASGFCGVVAEGSF